MKCHMTWKKNFIQRLAWLLAMGLMLCLMGCAQEEPTGTPVTMSYISSQGTKIVEQTVYLQGTGVEEQLSEVLTLLETPPQKLEYRVPLTQGVEVITTNVTNHALVLNLSTGYKHLDTLEEILTRASLVRSLTQIRGVDKVTIHVDGEPVKDSLGKTLGPMTADMFIDNSGEEISAYDKVTVRLYFANEAGDRLIAVDRSKAYNTNISLDKFVVEELLQGPDSKTQGVFPTINPESKLVSTFVKDRICYVNFDSNFLKKVNEVKAEIVVYSIVNTLCELPEIDRVQISVDGNSDIKLQEVISLQTIFSRNLDFVQTK